MAKKKSRPRKAPPRPLQRLLHGLAEADKLMEQERWADARRKLEELQQRYPSQPELLGALLDVYRALNDMEAYRQVAVQLIQLRPDDPNLALALAGAYLASGRLVHAVGAFAQFLQRWPDQPEAAEARRTAAPLERDLPQVLSGLGVSPEEAREVALQNERIQSDLARGRYREVRNTVDALRGAIPTLPSRTTT